MKEKQPNKETKELSLEISQATAYIRDFLQESISRIIKEISRDIAAIKTKIASNKYKKITLTDVSPTLILAKLEYYQKAVFFNERLRPINSILRNLERINNLEEYLQLVLVDSIYEFLHDAEQGIKHLKYHQIHQANIIKWEAEILLFYQNLSKMLLPKVSSLYLKHIAKLPILKYTESDVLKFHLNNIVTPKIINFTLKIQIKLNRQLELLDSLPGSSEKNQIKLLQEEIKKIKQQHAEQIIRFWKLFINQIFQGNHIIRERKDGNIVNTVMITILDINSMQNKFTLYMHDFYRITVQVNQLSKQIKEYYKSLESSNLCEAKAIVPNLDSLANPIEQVTSDVEIEDMLSEDTDELEDSKDDQSHTTLLSASTELVIDSSSEDVVDVLLPELSNKKKNLFRKILNEEKLSLQSLNQVAGLPFVAKVDPGREGSRMKMNCFNGGSINVHVPHGSTKGNSNASIILSTQNQQTLQAAARSYIEIRQSEMDGETKQRFIAKP